MAAAGASSAAAATALVNAENLLPTTSVLGGGGIAAPPSTDDSPNPVIRGPPEDVTAILSTTAGAGVAKFEGDIAGEVFLAQAYMPDGGFTDVLLPTIWEIEK